MSVVAYGDTCIVCGASILTMPHEIPLFPYCSTHSNADISKALDQVDELVANTRKLLETRPEKGRN